LPGVQCPWATGLPALTQPAATANCGLTADLDTNDTTMTEPSIDRLKIKIFADCADIKVLRDLIKQPFIKGVTTNPSLMRAAGATDYKAYAHDLLALMPDRPISFEVFADDFPTMERQAYEIATWGENVYVKIPVINSRREFAGPLISLLSRSGIKLNITAIMHQGQVARVAEALAGDAPALVSVFAGRVADTGRDPIPLMTESLRLLRNRPNAELLWASSRELFNIFQADALGVPVITAAPDHIKKLAGVGRDLDALSHDAVAAFLKDTVAAGFALDCGDRQRKAV
jgi:transaldolase